MREGRGGREGESVREGGREGESVCERERELFVSKILHFCSTIVVTHTDTDCGQNEQL